MTDTNFKRYLISGVTALLALGMTRCSDEQHYPLLPQGTAGAVEGEISIREDNLGDTALDIEVANLPPSIPNTPQKYYVAWGESPKETVRLGVVNREGDRGDLIATTDFKQFTVSITAESFPDAPKPSGAVILKSPTVVRRR